MKIQRRDFIQSSTALIAGTTWLGSTHAQQAVFPSKPIRLIIPSAAGGVSDVVARAYGEQMAKMLNQPVLIDNMPGAGTLLAVRHVLKSPPDGHTLIVSANTIVTLPYVDPKAGYSPSDFAGVADLSRMPMALVVGANSLYKTLAQLVDAAKKNPDALTFASVGVGTTSHLPVELFMQEAKMKMTMVPYKGIPLAIPDIIGERVTLMMGTAPSVGELIKAGKMRALAVTSETRSKDFPNVPTFKELGYPDANYELFISLLAPARTPDNVVKALADAVAVAKKDPELIKRLEGLGQGLSAVTTPEQTNKFLRKEEERMKKVVKEAHIMAEN